MQGPESEMRASNVCDQVSRPMNGDVAKQMDLKCTGMLDFLNWENSLGTSMDGQAF